MPRRRSRLDPDSTWFDAGSCPEVDWRPVQSRAGRGEAAVPGARSGNAGSACTCSTDRERRAAARAAGDEGEVPPRGGPSSARDPAPAGSGVKVVPARSGGPTSRTSSPSQSAGATAAQPSSRPPTSVPREARRDGAMVAEADRPSRASIGRSTCEISIAPRNTPGVREPHRLSTPLGDGAAARRDREPSPVLRGVSCRPERDVPGSAAIPGYDGVHRPVAGR